MTTKTWIDGTGNWNTAADWNTGTVPGPGDDAVILAVPAAASAEVVNFGSDLTAPANVAEAHGADTAFWGLSVKGKPNSAPASGQITNRFGDGRIFQFRLASVFGQAIKHVPQQLASR